MTSRRPEPGEARPERAGLIKVPSHTEPVVSPLGGPQTLPLEPSPSEARGRSGGV